MKYTSAGLSSTMAMTSGGRGVCGLHAQDFLVPDVPDSTPEVKVSKNAIFGPNSLPVIWTS